MKFDIDFEAVNEELKRINPRKVVDTLAIHEVSTKTGVLGKNIYVAKIKQIDIDLLVNGKNLGESILCPMMDVEIEVLDERVHLE